MGLAAFQSGCLNCEANVPSMALRGMILQLHRPASVRFLIPDHLSFCVDNASSPVLNWKPDQERRAIAREWLATADPSSR